MDIIKSPNDLNDYYTFELQNKMKVFLEHNKSIQISCVMMMVKVGYTMDKFNGMAHFLEHMLFNGTTKYPEEKYFSEFITKNGGHTNAFTTNETTCYYYTVNSDVLKKSLEIFSQFFISPLFKKDTISREREAVNAEHEKNINDDGWRYQNVLKQACDKNNPYKKFCTGCNSTLNVPNIDDEIRELFSLYYSSDIMTLLIVTNNDTEQTMNVVKKNFDPITIKEKPNMPNKKMKIFDAPKTINIVPVADINKVTLNWEIPAFKKTYHQNPTNFIAYLIGHEGTGTLYNYLLNSGYILNLHCGIYEKVGNNSIFFIDVTLSELGEQNTDKIIGLVFLYIDIIKNAFEQENSHLIKLYEEQQKIKQHTFRFLEQDDPEEKCMGYYEVLTTCEIPLKYILSIMYVSDSFNKIKNNAICILDMLELNKCIVVKTSKKYEKICKKTDEYYGTKFEISNNLPKISVENIDIKLPKLNKYISLGTSLIKNKNKTPKHVENGYLLETSEFRNPDININLSIYLPLSMLDGKKYVQTLIYFATILLNVGHEKYMCETAGYYIQMQFDTGKLHIEIQGNYKGILKVCDFFMTSIISPKFTKDEFDRTIYSFNQNDINLSFETPHVRTTMYFNKTILLKYFTHKDRLQFYDKITYEETISLKNNIFELGTFNLLVSGNCTEDMYNKICHCMKSVKPTVTYSVTNDLLSELVVETHKDLHVMIKKENQNEKNHAVCTYLFIENVSNVKNTLQSRCLLEILKDFISQEYFYQLRTQEKFGYIVGSNISFVGNNKSEYMYFKYIVQSPKKSITEMIDRTTKFIRDFKSNIDSISPEEFKSIVDSCIKTKKDPATNLNDLAAEKFKEIQCGLETFNLNELMINEFSKLKIKDIQKFYYEKFLLGKKIYICV